MKIKKIFQINLRGLILSISIASMLVTLTNGYLSIYNVYKELFANQLAKINIDYSSRLAASVENVLSISKKQMTYSARFISKYFPDTSQIQEETDRIFQLSQNFNSVIIVDNNNNLVAFSPDSNVQEVNKLVADTSLSPLQPDNVAASLPYKTNENDYAIALSAPIVSEQGVHLGDIRGAIHLTKLRIMDEFTPLNNDRSMVYIIDNEGNTIYHYNNKVPLGEHINDQQLKKATASQDTGSFMMPDEQSNLVLAGFAKVHKTGWTVITLQSSAVTDKALNNVMYSVLKEATPVALLTLLVLMIFAVFIARPLRQLAMTASRMSEQGAISQIRAVPSWYVEAAQLKDAILLGTMMLHKRIGRLSSEAHTDPLTGLLNRRGLQEGLEMVMLEKKSVSVVVIDIDNFKQVNDTYGHDIGDEVIRQLGQQIRSNARKMDIMCRTGGEEFLMLLPGTDVHIASIIAERLRKSVERMIFPMCRHVTVSLGVTSFTPKQCPLDMAVKTADNALYKAKNTGRNRVVVEYIASGSIAPL